MRKKTLLLVVLVFLLTGCFLFGEKEPIQVNDIILNENRGVDIDLSVNYRALEIEKGDIDGYGIVILEGTPYSIYEINFEFKDDYYETTEVNNNVATISIDNFEEVNFETTYSIRAYIRYNEDEFIYENEYFQFSLYELAKSSESEFARHIINYVEKESISRVEIEIDYENNLVTTEQSIIEVVSKEEDDYLNLEITPKTGFYFHQDVELIINGIKIDNDDYYATDNEITYEFRKKSPKDYVPVKVRFTLAGGYWTKEVLQYIEPTSSLVATSFDDKSKLTYTILDYTATAYRYYYKIFIKYDEITDAYQVVAVDYKTSHIASLEIEDYDYVLAVHDNCVDTDAVKLFKEYTATDDTIGMYVLFNENIEEYTSGNITTKFYEQSKLSSDYIVTLYEEKSLPIPYRESFNFIGWSDGENIYQTFPRYLLKDKIKNITYTAVWEAYSFDEFKDYISEILPEIVEGDITLPTSYSNYSITWESSHEDIISSTGKYRKPYVQTIVVLKATLTAGKEKHQLSFEILAKGYKKLTTGIASSYIYTKFHLVNDEFFEILDIINCAFITADAYGDLSGSTFLANVSKHIIPKARMNGNWVVMSIAPESKWSSIAANPERVENFANNIVKMINEYGFDGVDIDWETPTTAEKELFTALMKVVYQKVKQNNPHHLVTAAIAGGKWQPPRYDLNNSQQYIDYINMMTYGMTNSNGQYQNALYRSPSFHNTHHRVGRTLDSCSIEESIAFYKNNYNIPYRKIIVGLAFYGMKQIKSGNDWVDTKHSSGYTSIINDYLNNPNYTEYYDENAQVPYILKNDGTEFISYDNPRSVIAKSEYVLEHNLGGIMFWQYGHNTSGELLKAIKTGLKK